MIALAVRNKVLFLISLLYPNSDYTHFHSPSSLRRRKTVKSMRPLQPSSRTRAAATVSSTASTPILALKLSIVDIAVELLD